MLVPGSLFIPLKHVLHAKESITSSNPVQYKNWEGRSILILFWEWGELYVSPSNNYAGFRESFHPTSTCISGQGVHYLIQSCTVQELGRQINSSSLLGGRGAVGAQGLVIEICLYGNIIMRVNLPFIWACRHLSVYLILAIYLHSRLYPCGRNKRQGLDPSHLV